jgi:IclR family mhp operon transcriptional activator
MFKTPLGWAYLAYCRDVERREILDHLRKSLNPDDAPARDPAFVESMTCTILANGYASSSELRPDRYSSIALPIMNQGVVRGCIATLWPSALLSHERAIPRYLPVLQEAKVAIEAGLNSAGTEW